MPFQKITLPAALVTLLMFAPAHANDVSDDFPSSCEVESSGDRHQEKYERFSLGTLHSMADSCAFGDRIQSMINGAMSEIFGALSDMLDFADQDFFCGFGTDDVWGIGAETFGEGTIADGSQSFNQFRNSAFSTARGEVRNYSRDWTDDRRGDFNEHSENVFDSIFDTSGGGDESNSDGNGLW